TVTVDGSGDLTNLTNPDGGLRTFTYDSSHRMTNDKFSLLNATFAYDANNGTLSTVTLDTSVTLGVSPANEPALTTSTAKNANQTVAVLTDALSRATTYTLNTLGQPIQIQTADGATRQWTRDFAGSMVSST